MQDWTKQKTVGSRKPADANPLSEEWSEYLKLLWDLRQDKTFVPKGVYKFKTFEEANEWMERMRMGEKPTAGHPPQKTHAE